jgi:hypothetical protein
MQMQMMGTPVGFAPCVAQAVKGAWRSAAGGSTLVVLRWNQVKINTTALRAPRGRLYLTAYFMPQGS